MGSPRRATLAVAARGPDRQDLLRSRFPRALRQAKICAVEACPRTSKPPLACRWLVRRALSSCRGFGPPPRSLAATLPQGGSDAKRGRIAQPDLLASANGQAR